MPWNPQLGWVGVVIVWVVVATIFILLFEKFARRRR